MNTQDKNIKFTTEHSLETIPLLDVKIKINDTGIITWVYRNPVNTDLFLNFNAKYPIKWKSGLIFCLLNHVKRICSSDFLFDNEVKFLKSVFLNIGFLIKFENNIYFRINDQHNMMTRLMKTALLYHTLEKIHTVLLSEFRL